ncbi:purine phosphorylase family 1 [Actinoplanes sp. SE50]|uniref:purine phosphorylase family 1 n=1 Tax=unclassified Actinoplanes TaxID=2626549 RepID=UPI00023ECD41|nr:MULTISPECIES: purine phosphorylase family 1 [unclassified Actinoplanes]AEV86576.1 purine phosphorylase family 1 [Actinoplanes sp. SE50/110]ATO84974.1 purine phosphorylase family 1 [Actinoplanes sp. SE50]SLM02383.1 purine phosphorylase family 1 [Actinoplanes sp. SE50/110]
MEAAGVAKAGHLNAAPVAVIRGISDFANGTKAASDGASWQPRAAEHAAAFAAALAAEIRPRRTAAPSAARQAEPVTVENHNTVTGNARVGMQGGTIAGDVHFGAGFWDDATGSGRR